MLPKHDIVGSNPIARSKAWLFWPGFLICKDSTMTKYIPHARITGWRHSRMSKATILYVEDNVDNRTLVRRVLTADGYKVTEASDATDALDSINKQRPDLILMDINMPGVDGYTLTTRIKTMPGLQYVPIIALTANVMRGDREKSLEAGCDGYIQKPIDIDTISQYIERYLRKI
jgi:two-component system cell cycle response regulator DivK